jgi:hypothetical protein
MPETCLAYHVVCLAYALHIPGITGIPGARAGVLIPKNTTNLKMRLKIQCSNVLRILTFSSTLTVVDTLVGQRNPRNEWADWVAGQLAALGEAPPEKWPIRNTGPSEAIAGSPLVGTLQL